MPNVAVWGPSWPIVPRVFSFIQKPMACRSFGMSITIPFGRVLWNGPLESGWSSHRAYLGLEECPPWLATEAIFGGDVTEHEAIRRELADYVDEGRAEGRRPELSGEVSSKLTRRIHQLMGKEVSLSYPVLGPDSFVVESLKEQVRRHRDRTTVKNDVTVERLIEKVFEAMGLAPELARSRSRRPDIARGRAPVAWLWGGAIGQTAGDGSRRVDG